MSDAPWQVRWEFSEAVRVNELIRAERDGWALFEALEEVQLTLPREPQRLGESRRALEDVGADGVDLRVAVFGPLVVEVRVDLADRRVSVVAVRRRGLP